MLHLHFGKIKIKFVTSHHLVLLYILLTYDIEKVGWIGIQTLTTEVIWNNPTSYRVDLIYPFYLDHTVKRVEKSNKGME